MSNDPGERRGQWQLCASLPWYEFGEIEWATRAFWAALAGRLRGLGVAGVPDALTSEDDWARVWRRPGLLLSQSCGYDAILPYRGLLRVVATPCYRAPGCAGPTYSSAVLVREDAPYRSLEDLRGSRCVVNHPTSHSGVNGLRALVSPLSRQGRFFAEVSRSGSHVRSLLRIRAGQADVAAVDCVVVELVRRLRPELLLGLRTVAVTPAAPAPPYVTRASLPEATFERLQAALTGVAADPDLAPVREALLLDRVELLPVEAYDSMAAIHRAAAALGYHELDGRGEAAPA